MSEQLHLRPSPAAPAVTRPQGRLLLPISLTFYLQASIVVFFLAASSASTPLYALYQREWGFSTITTTIIFGVYAVAVLIALLVFGSLSDHIGRRPVLLTAIAVQALMMIGYATATGVPELLAIRVVQGLATGAAIAAVGAGMLDISRARGTLANSLAAPIGTGLGSIASGVLVQYLPAPTRLVYLVLLVIFVLQGLGVALMRETAELGTGARRTDAITSLRVSFSVPRGVRSALLVAAPILLAAWALAGFYGSLGPSIVRNLTGQSSPVQGGLPLFVLAIAGAAAVAVLRSAGPRTVMSAGAAALVTGVGITLIGMRTGSPATFFAGTAVAGFGFGAGFQGAVRSVVPLAGPQERAGVLSIIYVISYLALGLPAVIAGFLVVHGGGVIPTSLEYGIAVMVLATLALLGSLAGRRRSGDQDPAVVTSPATSRV